MTEQETCERFIGICKHHKCATEGDVEELIQKHHGKLSSKLTNELSLLYDRLDSIDERTHLKVKNNEWDNLMWQGLEEFLTSEKLI